MTQVEVCASLAACIRRAERENPGQEPTNDFYWYTRERCVDLALSRGITILRLIRTVSHEFSTYTEGLDMISSPFWDEVVHPELLCKEVLES